MNEKIESKFTFWPQEGFKLGRKHVDSRKRVFDWDKFTYYLLNMPTQENVYIGLNGDFDQSCTLAIKDYTIQTTFDKKMWLTSTFCMPAFSFDMESGKECWTWRDESEFNNKTFWPKHCVARLHGKYE
jgi:hypothetical protein